MQAEGLIPSFQIELSLSLSQIKRWVSLYGLLLFVACGTGCGDIKRFGYEGFGRDGWQTPDKVIRSLELEEGDRVADLGAGGGYFTFRLADAVGGGGKVYAADIDSNMIEHLQQRARDEGYRNVEAVRGDVDDPLLPEDSLDLVFTCNTYHHLPDRIAYFARLKKYLRAGGRVAVIEFNGEGWFQKLFKHSTDAEVIRSEMQAAGYRQERSYDYLPRQHFLVFSKVGP